MFGSAVDFIKAILYFLFTLLQFDGVGFFENIGEVNLGIHVHILWNPTWYQPNKLLNLH